MELQEINQKLRQDLTDVYNNMAVHQNRTIQAEAYSKHLREDYEGRIKHLVNQIKARDELWKCASERLNELDPKWMDQPDCPGCARAKLLASMVVKYD